MNDYDIAAGLWPRGGRAETRAAIPGAYTAFPRVSTRHLAPRHVAMGTCDLTWLHPSRSICRVSDRVWQRWLVAMAAFKLWKTSALYI